MGNYKVLAFLKKLHLGDNVNKYWENRAFRSCFMGSIVIVLLLSGCLPVFGNDASSTPVNNDQVDEIDESLPLAEVVFRVETPSQAPQGEQVFLDILDEVTGLGLNPLRYPMAMESPNNYVAHIPVGVGSVVKYRYTREGSPPAVEYTSTGKQVRYRLFYADGPAEVKDIVSAWNDYPYSGPVGRIQGQVVDIATGVPVPNLLVTAGGCHTITSSNGYFLLDGMALGVHNLVVYSLDGAFQPFQQGAVIAAESATQADIQVMPSQFVSVTFVAHGPPENIPGIPIKLVGNIYQLGNTFADLDGGVNVVASRAPYMTLASDGIYTLTIYLPAGLDLRYKYTLGDGFWNAEHSSDVRFKVRQMIVPKTDTVVEDTIDSWYSGSSQPVNFSVTAPPETPANETVSIQFNPYGWTEPIPMWPLGNNQWMYIVYSPLELLGDVQYRFCRNDQCGVADDIATGGDQSSKYSFAGGEEAQEFEHQIQSWEWWQELEGSTTIDPVDIIPRGASFITGIEFQSGYHPSWQPYMGGALQAVSDLGANTVILSPTWHYTRTNLPVLEPVPGEDALWYDMGQIGAWGQQRDLNLIIYPQTKFSSMDELAWWQAAEKDAGWWRSWFDRYSAYLIHHADLANHLSAEGLVLGELGALPSFPDGALPDGTSSGVINADEEWAQLIDDVRSRYSGTLYWVVNYDEELQSLPDFVTRADSIYLIWSAPLSEQDNASQTDLMNAFERLLDEEILPFKERINKPILLAIGYPSIDGAANGCVTLSDNCFDFSVLDQPSAEFPELSIDLDEQVNIYNAALQAVNQRDWIDGFVSRGYYPPAILHDLSSSVHGKPSADVLWYWYSKFSE
jgi:hypothetical protein